MYSLDDISLEHWQVTGLKTRVARLGEGPVALLIHGWPECWYCWREQMVALANAGYQAIAPDMPGFGETDSLPEITDYNVVRICAFMQGMIEQANGGKPVVLIGHDWGAINCWQFVQRQPEWVSRLINMSVPLRPMADVPPLVFLRGYFGKKFFYQIYFQEPGVAEAEFDADPEGILRALYCSPDTPRAPALLGPSTTEGGGWIGRLGRPLEQADWVTDEALNYYIDAYRHSGFAGGINYYRNLDDNWQVMQPWRDSQIACPVLFIVGSKDMTIQGMSEDKLREMMSPRIPDLQMTMLPGKGHWIQSEATAEVNASMLAFLGD